MQSTYVATVLSAHRGFRLGRRCLPQVVRGMWGHSLWERRESQLNRGTPAPTGRPARAEVLVKSPVDGFCPPPRLPSWVVFRVTCGTHLSLNLFATPASGRYA